VPCATPLATCPDRSSRPHARQTPGTASTSRTGPLTAKAAATAGRSDVRHGWRPIVPSSATAVPHGAGSQPLRSPRRAADLPAAPYGRFYCCCRQRRSAEVGSRR
jgi:hypothetical protein